MSTSAFRKILNKERDREGEPQMKRPKHSEEEEEEYVKLSDLPDDIILHIMKFMKTKDAVQTCILSKHWENLWKLLPILRLHSSDFPKLGSFKKYVSKVLSGRDSSVALQSLSLKRDGFIEPKLLNRVARYATSHNVQELSIDVGFSYYLEIPPCIFSCKSITSLKISLFSRSRLGLPAPLPKSLALSALKSLHLVNVTFSASNEDCAEPFSNCEKLNSLIIESCFCEGNALFISSNKLSSLAIGSKYVRKVSYKIKLSTPNLNSFTFSGCSTHELSAECNLPLLEEVEISVSFFSFEGFKETACMMTSFLRVFANNVELLSLSWPTLEAILYMLRAMNTQPPCFSNLKSLIVIKRKKFPVRNEKLKMILECLLQNSSSNAIEILYS